MTCSVIRRTEMFEARLDLGGQPIELSEYATTGLVALAVAPRGQGKTNAGLLIGEQLAAQGWVSVYIVIRMIQNNSTENFFGPLSNYA